MNNAPEQVCPLCASKGTASRLKFYQINFDEAFVMCGSTSCLYPLGVKTLSDSIVGRKMSEISISARKKRPARFFSQANSPVAGFANKTMPAVNRVCSRLQSPLVGMNNVDALQPVATNLNSTKGLPLSQGRAPNASPIIQGRAHIELKQGIPSTVSKFLAYTDSKELRSNTSDTNINHLLISDKNTVSAPSVLVNANVEDFVINAQPIDFVNQIDVQTDVQQYDRTAEYVQWANKDALCWLDVVLCILCHCRSLSKCITDQDESVIKTLLLAYQQAQCLLQKVNSSKAQMTTSSDAANTCGPEADATDGQKKSLPKDTLVDSLGKTDTTVRTGAGLKKSKLLVPSCGDEENHSQALGVLDAAREEIWKSLQPKLNCVKGRNDSPVFALDLLLGDEKFKDKFVIDYDFVLRCTECGHQTTDSYKKMLVTFPSTADDFSLEKPSFLRSCFKCSAENQRREMVYKRLSDGLLMHFVNGVPEAVLNQLDFSHHGNSYQATGIVQYKNNPDHFVAWVKETNAARWMECDDLKSPIGRFSESKPRLSASQVHIVLWEKTNSMEPCGENPAIATPYDADKTFSRLIADRTTCLSAIPNIIKLPDIVSTVPLTHTIVSPLLVASIASCPNIDLTNGNGILSNAQGVCLMVREIRPENTPIHPNLAFLRKLKGNRTIVTKSPITNGLSGSINGRPSGVDQDNGRNISERSNSIPLTNNNYLQNIFKAFKKPTVPKATKQFAGYKLKSELPAKSESANDLNASLKRKLDNVITPSATKRAKSPTLADTFVSNCAGDDSTNHGSTSPSIDDLFNLTMPDDTIPDMESQVLQDLYKALNLQVPENSSTSVSSPEKDELPWISRTSKSSKQASQATTGMPSVASQKTLGKISSDAALTPKTMMTPCSMPFIGVACSMDMPTVETAFQEDSVSSEDVSNLIQRNVDGTDIAELSLDSSLFDHHLESLLLGD